MSNKEEKQPMCEARDWLESQLPGFVCNGCGDPRCHQCTAGMAQREFADDLASKLNALVERVAKAVAETMHGRKITSMSRIVAAARRAAYGKEGA